MNVVKSGYRIYNVTDFYSLGQVEWIYDECVLPMWTFGRPIIVTPKALSGIERVGEAFNEFSRPPRMLSDMNRRQNI